MPWHTLLLIAVVYYAVGFIALAVVYWEQLGHWSDPFMIALGALIWPILLADALDE